jgi:hypothetical protein
MGSGLAALAGILGGFGQVPKSLEQMDENERSQQRLAQQAGQFAQTNDLQRQTLAETQRHNQFVEGKEARAQARLPGLAEAVRSSATTPGQLTQGLSAGEDPEAAAMLPRTQTFTDPGMTALAKLIPMMDPARAEAATAEALKPRVVGDKQRLWMPGHGFMDPTPAGPPRPQFQPPAGYVPEYSVKDDGSTTTTYKARVDLTQRVSDILQEMGVTPLTATPAQIGAARKQANEEELRLAAAKVNVQPNSAETTQLVVGAERARKAAQAIQQALQDPNVDNYLGPYAQYRSKGQRAAPYGLAGDVPPAVVDVEQNLAHLKNYTIRLITGAAVRPDEEGRITNEIVDASYRGPEFRQRLGTTLKNIQYLEQRVKDLALRGDRNAQAVAQELGLLGGARQGGGANISPQPNSGWKIERVQ